MRGRAVLAVTALAAAASLALLGRAVLALPGNHAASGPGLPARVVAAPPAGGLAAWVVGSAPDGRFAKAVAIYEQAVSFPATAGDPRGPVAIARLIPSLPTASERAQAWTMAGTLLAYSAGSGFGVVLPRRSQAPTDVVLAQAIDDYRSALAESPTAEDAKFDLELLLHQRSVQSPPEGKGHRRVQRTAQDHRRRTAGSLGQEHHAGIYATGSGY